MAKRRIQIEDIPQNASRWTKKEEGGYVDEYSNPYHPIHQYMATGGYVNPWAPQNPNSDDDNAAIAQGRASEEDNATPQPPKDPNKNLPPASPQYPTNDEPVQVAPQSDMYSTAEPQEQPPQPRQRNNGVANWGSAILGVGTGILGAASILNDKFNNQKVNQRWIRDQGMSDNMPKYINMQGKGTTDQYGNMPYNNGITQSPNIRTMREGGYTKNQVVDLSESEIAAMIRAGYKLQRVK